MAWLHATPDREDRRGVGVPRRVSLQNKQNLGLEQPDLNLPEVEGGQHLIDYLFRVGPMSGGEILSFSELAAWCELTGVRLTPWEAETLRSLSGAYGAELQDAKDPKRPAPVTSGAEA